jgi:hypothetical protein
MPNLWTVNDGQLTLNQHPGQARAWQSQKRIVAVLAGTQGGKTSWLPWWLMREIRWCGQGDYLAVTANYDLFKLKFLPTLREVFEHTLGWGRYWAADRIIELSDPATGRFQAKRADDPMWARIILRSAESGGGLESATARAAILDEAGMDSFTLGSWLALRRRLSLSRGRICLGTTIYNLGWLKQQIYDPWERAKGQHPELDVIQFDSAENPEFPREEYEWAERNLPEWKFLMFYRGRYARPAGQIYDAFNDRLCKVPRFAIPDAWPRFLGLDFGGVHTAGMFYAAEPGTGRLYAYREYLEGGRTAAEHAKALLAGEPMVPTCVGGSGSEDQWRAEFRAGGLPVREPDITEVELGIDRVYGAHKRNEILVFEDLAGYLDQKARYSRPVDAAGNVLPGIQNKATFHFLDAERYIVGWLKRPKKPESERPQSHSYTSLR